jgi:hypothetical protein
MWLRVWVAQRFQRCDKQKGGAVLSGLRQSIAEDWRALAPKVFSTATFFIAGKRH